MIPESMKRPFWLVPVSILSVTGGMFFLAVYFFPEFSPHLRENMFRRGLHVAAPWVAFINIVIPVFALWFHTNRGEGDAD